MIAALLVAAAPLAVTDEPVDFARDVRPLLERSCVDCHRAIDDDGAPRRPEGGLVLGHPAGILAGGQGGPVVVPGDAAGSRLVQVVALPPEDPDAMPPRGTPISEDERAVIAAWIDAGAPFGEPGDDTPVVGADVAAPRDERVPERVARWTRLAEGLAPPDPAVLSAAREDGLLVELLWTDAPLLRVETRRADGALAGHLAALAPHVVALDLGRSDVDDETLARLPRLPRLVRLDAERTRLGDGAVEVLRRFDELAVVNLHGTRVGDGAVDALARLPRLRRVYLWDSRVTPAGARRLSAARPDVDVVATRDLPAPAAPSDARR